MKYLAILFITLLVFSMTFQATIKLDTLHLKSGCVTLYEHINYQGKSLNVCKNIANFVPLKWNDIASSIKVGQNTVVHLYEHVNYGGKVLSLTTSHPNFVTLKWNDKASSIKVSKSVPHRVQHHHKNHNHIEHRAPCAIIYEHVNYSGKHLAVCKNIGNLVSLGWND